MEVAARTGREAAARPTVFLWFESDSSAEYPKISVGPPSEKRERIGPPLQYR